jgi:hypothetical protein
VSAQFTGFSGINQRLGGEIFWDRKSLNHDLGNGHSTQPDVSIIVRADRTCSNLVAEISYTTNSTQLNTFSVQMYSTS